MLPSLPSWPVATPATTMLCASIILPMTPPALLAAAASNGDKPTRRAVICAAFIAFRAGGGARHHDALRVDHLTHAAAGAIGGRGQQRRHAHPAGGDLLQAATKMTSRSEEDTS